MWVKICANTDLHDAQLAADAGADALGFIFAPSKRQVTPEQVAAITPHLPKNVEKIGVFITQDVDEILRIADLTGLTGVQVHSAFVPEFVQQIKQRTNDRLRVLQVVDFPAASTTEAATQFEQTMRELLAEPAVDAVLLDTAVKGASGGTGVAFDWAVVAEVLRRISPTDLEGPRIILAGGLRPENVAEAIMTLLPHGVDVASGVESTPGSKDPARVKAFIQAARRAS